MRRSAHDAFTMKVAEAVTTLGRSSSFHEVMPAPLSLVIARTLLALAGGLVLVTLIFITAASQDRVGAAPWLLLLAFDAAAFFGAGWLLGRDPGRAKTLAVGAALGMGALGAITGFGAGMLSFPAAAVGALAAWAAFLHPPTRLMALAFAAYLAIGVLIAVISAGQSFATVFTLLFILIWPGRFLLLPGSSGVVLYLLLGAAASTALLALVRRRAFGAPVSARQWAALILVSAVAGASAVALFNALALSRPNTSARFELDALVLSLTFAGGALAAFGAITLRTRPTLISAFALGIGATLLFMTVGSRPAVTCMRNGTSQGTPLAWMLRAAFDGGSTSTYSSGGSSGTGLGGGSANVTTGELRYGTRLATYRCEGDQLAEFRELTR